uniref:Glyco_hydro_38C domain-containing protein n=1 Tax=Macrostomum lignano TaxID=282301 RepID=A0A1I8FL97_9PLAT
ASRELYEIFCSRNSHLEYRYVWSISDLGVRIDAEIMRTRTELDLDEKPFQGPAAERNQGLWTLRASTTLRPVAVAFFNTV